MGDLSGEVIQSFSDRVADLCEQFAFDEDQMLQAIGSTFIGAVLSFGRTDYQLEVTGLATALVESCPTWASDEGFIDYCTQLNLLNEEQSQLERLYTEYLNNKERYESVQAYVDDVKREQMDRGRKALDDLLGDTLDI
jgi:hypothetical protein